MGSFFKECEHPESRWPKCPHPYKVRYRSATGRQTEESGYATQDTAVERLLGIYNVKKESAKRRREGQADGCHGRARPGEQASREMQPIRSDGQGGACLPDSGRPADAWDRAR
ncbi:hypothetical protein GCM10010360_26650 [Streptomyces nogalater]